MGDLTFISRSEEETKKFAARLGRSLKANDCLALIGDFGSGKTTFVKGLVQGLGSRKKNYVCSPSFVILKNYPGRLPVYHFDLYRINRPKDFEDAGLEDFLSAGGVSVLEWADRFLKLLPREYLKIRFFISGPNARRMKFSSQDRRFRSLIKKAIA
jgi:tRNA threonylcarbamoyladenosine biosynthesis protein TsaE